VIFHGQDGFVNSLAIAKSGRFIVAGVGRVRVFPIYLKIFWLQHHKMQMM
jgi:hypothetical protein